MEAISRKDSFFKTSDRDPKNQLARIIELYGREVFPCAQCGRPVTVKYLLSQNYDGNGIFHNASCAEKFTRACNRQKLSNAEIDSLKSFYREVIAIPFVGIPTTRKRTWTKHAENPHSFLGVRKNKPFRSVHGLKLEHLPKGTPKRWIDFYYGSAKLGQFPTIPEGFVFTHQKFLHLNNRGGFCETNVRSGQS